MLEEQGTRTEVSKTKSFLGFLDAFHQDVLMRCKDAVMSKPLRKGPPKFFKPRAKYQIVVKNSLLLLRALCLHSLERFEEEAPKVFSPFRDIFDSNDPKVFQSFVRNDICVGNCRVR